MSQKFPIWAVIPKLGISELWSKGIWGPALKGPNGVRVYFDKPSIKTLYAKLTIFLLLPVSALNTVVHD